MKQEYMEAFSEVDEILEIMPTALSNKIPQKFKEIIKNEKSKDYIPNIKEPIDKCPIREETIIILALIYRDFLCNEEERKKLKSRDAQALRIFEEELRERYNPDDIFKKKKEKKQEMENIQVEETSIAVIQEKKWYKKIFNIIKKFFLKNLHY